MCTESLRCAASGNYAILHDMLAFLVMVYLVISIEDIATENKICYHTFCVS